MKASYRWICEFLPPEISLAADEMARLLTAQGLEVEAIEENGGLDARIVVAEVLQKKPHPNAERLSLCQVSTGKDVFLVVCGAANVEQGGRYAFAQLGAVLPKGMVIRAATIRGELSQGMLCSESELALPESQPGLLVLPAASLLGSLVSDVPGIRDTIFTIAVTPNRGDCLSHLGIARELLARFPEWSRGRLRRASQVAVSRPEWTPFAVRLDTAEAELYLGRPLGGVVMAPSPFWVRRRLLACGIRPVNTIVDATNYLLLERGHPVHAFDLKALRGTELCVRHAHPNELLRTLDGKMHTLCAEDLVVSDGAGAVALAGIMGGEGSQITEGTREIFLECALFRQSAVRQSAKRLGLGTESSYRFERGVDRAASRQAMERLTELILEWSGGAPVDVGPVVSAGCEAVSCGTIALSCDRVAALLGLSLARERIAELLRALEFQVEERGQHILAVTPPCYRLDIEGAADVVEEIARMLGYENLPTALPMLVLTPAMPEEPRRAHVERLRSLLVARGFSQTLHMSFRAAGEAPLFAESSAIHLQNPLSEREASLRQSLGLQLLGSYAQRERSAEREWKWFEMGTVFQKNQHPSEREHLALLWASPQVDFFEVKGMVETLLAALAISYNAASFVEVNAKPWRRLLHPGRSAALQVEGVEKIWLGALHPEVAKALKLKGQPFIAEFELVGLWPYCSQDIEFKKFSQFPKTQRDVTVVVDEVARYQDLAAFFSAEKETTASLSQVEFLNLYRGDPLPPGKKSLSFRLHYGAMERTLTDSEVNDSYFALIEKIKREKKVEIR